MANPFAYIYTGTDRCTSGWGEKMIRILSSIDHLFKSMHGDYDISEVYS